MFWWGGEGLIPGGQEGLRGVEVGVAEAVLGCVWEGVVDRGMCLGGGGQGQVRAARYLNTSSGSLYLLPRTQPPTPLMTANLGW